MYKFTVKFSIGKKRMQRTVDALDEGGAKEELKKQIKFHSIIKIDTTPKDSFAKNFTRLTGLPFNGWDGKY